MAKKRPEPSSWSWSDGGKTGSGGAWKNQTKKSQAGCLSVAGPALAVGISLLLRRRNR